MDCSIITYWNDLLNQELDKEYFKNLLFFLEKEYSLGKNIYPASKDVFNAFRYTSFEEIKVVILGQDPYHQINQAQGLSFSVSSNCKIPKSLLNIYKEVERDIGTLSCQDGDLRPWAKQGVLLLNTTLTVEENKPGSHFYKGWEQFTAKVIELINNNLQNIVFLLWGKYAQSFGNIIDRENHMVLESSHPSPLSAYRGFVGCKHFSLTNQYLKNYSKSEIVW